MAKKNNNRRLIDKMTPESEKFMDIIRMVESTDRSGVRAGYDTLVKNGKDTTKEENYVNSKNETMSAYGYYQFLGSTWNGYNAQYETDYGKKLNPNIREHQHEMMRYATTKYITQLENLDLPVTAENMYAIHLLGSGTFDKLAKERKSSKNVAEAGVSESAILNNEPLLKKDGKLLTVPQFFENLKSHLKEKEKDLAKQTPERAKEVEKEKLGYYTGNRTPVSLDPGTFDENNKNNYSPNRYAFNGTSLGSNQLEYVMKDITDPEEVRNPRIIKSTDEELFSGRSLVNNKDRFKDDDEAEIKVISPGKTKTEIAPRNFKPEPVPDLVNYSDANIDTSQINEQYADSNPNGMLVGDPNIKSFSGVIPDVSVDPGQVGSFNRSNEGGNQLSEQDIYSAVGRFANPKNPYMQSGNVTALNQNIGNNQVVSLDDPVLTNIDPSTFLNSDSNILANVDSPSSQAQPNQQVNLELGGDLDIMMNNMAQEQNIVNPENNDLIEFNSGGTHEQNPVGGIPQNENEDGSINTVEQGETKHKDYVFSDSLKVSESLAKDLRLPKEVIGHSFADASKILNQFLKENPDDIIVKRTVNKQLDNLKVGNDKARVDNQKALDDFRVAQQEIPEEELQEQLPPEGDINQFSEEDLNINEFEEGGWLKRNSSEIGQGISGGLDLFSTIASFDDIEQEEEIKPGQSALAGAAAGAAAGSVIPGWGTAIGAVVGGVGGLISGGAKAKKQARRIARETDRKRELSLAPARDYRSDSGFIEHTLGGNMKVGLGGRAIFDEEDFLNNIDALGNQTSQQYNNSVGQVNNNDDIDDSTTVRRNNSNTNRPFKPRGENLLQYASLLESYRQSQDANRRSPTVETYRSSGRRMTPNEIDENTLMRELRRSANTADNLIISNAGGNTAVARSGVLANRLNTNRAISDAVIKAEEYNETQRQTALDYNNQLDRYDDELFNKYSSMNTRHRSAQEAERFARRRDFVNSLAGFGRERSNRNAAYNVTGGYDRYGNYNTNAFQQMAESLGLILTPEQEEVIKKRNQENNS